jgi:hypothetical protein
MIHRLPCPNLRFLISVLREHLRAPFEFRRGFLQAMVDSTVVQPHHYGRCLGYLLGDSPLLPPIETLIEDSIIVLESRVGVSSTNHGLQRSGDNACFQWSVSLAPLAESGR